MPGPTKDLVVYPITPLPSQDFINHSQYPKELQEMLLGNFNPYTENLKFPKVTKSLATSKEF